MKDGLAPYESLDIEIKGLGKITPSVHNVAGAQTGPHTHFPCDRPGFGILGPVGNRYIKRKRLFKVSGGGEAVGFRQHIIARKTFNSAEQTVGRPELSGHALRGTQKKNDRK